MPLSLKANDGAWRSLRLHPYPWFVSPGKRGPRSGPRDEAFPGPRADRTFPLTSSPSRTPSFAVCRVSRDSQSCRSPAPRLPSELLRKARRVRGGGKCLFPAEAMSGAALCGGRCPGTGRSAGLQPRSSPSCCAWGNQRWQVVVGMEWLKRDFPCYIVKVTLLALCVPGSFASLRQGRLGC